MGGDGRRRRETKGGTCPDVHVLKEFDGVLGIFGERVGYRIGLQTPACFL